MRPRLVLVLSVLSVAFAACRRPPPVGTFPSAPVVLVSIDTLRADHLALYGYASGATPHLDRLGREGIVFDDVYSHAPLTLPSHASLFTGLLPPRHGVRDNIGFTLKDHETLASRFKAVGYRTGGGVSAYVMGSQTGIARGFDIYDDRLEVPGPASESLGEIQRDGATALESLSRWIESEAGDRFFAFLHLYEPHSPYTPPARYARLAPYDGEIAYADELVGRLLDHLRARNLYDRSIIVVTSDHGEGLGQHGEAEHGIFLYREAVRVPLVVRLPGGARGGTRVAGAVAEVDIPATILDLSGVPSTGLDGASLRDAMSARVARPGRVYSETLYGRFHFGWSELYAATEGRFRYIKAPRPELYDVDSDPGETQNLAQTRRQVTADLDAWLARSVGVGAATPTEVPPEVREKLQALGYIGSAGNRKANEARADPKDKVRSYEDLKHALRLRAQGKDPEAVEQLRTVLAANPEMIDAWEVLGTTLVRMGRYREGTEALQRTLTLDPARAQTRIALVKAHVLQGNISLALKEAEQAAAGDAAHGYEVLAQLMLDLGELNHAASFARKSLAADDQRTLSHFVLGLVAQRRERYEEALAHFRRAAELASQVKGTVIRNLHAKIADCLARLGNEAEAEREFKAEIEEMPASRDGRVGLAMLYRSQGRDTEARDVLSGLVAAEPQPSADTYWTVVRAFTVLGDVQAAREWTARARTLFPSDYRFR